MRESLWCGLPAIFRWLGDKLFYAISADDNGRLWQHSAPDNRQIRLRVGGLCQLCVNRGICSAKSRSRHNRRKHKRDKRAR